MEQLRRSVSITCLIASLAALCGAAAPGALTVTPMSIDYGVVTVGLSSQARAITVSNQSGKAVSITSFSISDSHFQLFEGTAPITVANGGTAFYVMRFVPTAGQTYSATFTLNVEG